MSNYIKLYSNFLELTDKNYNICEKINDNPVEVFYLLLNPQVFKLVIIFNLLSIYIFLELVKEKTFLMVIS